MLNFMLTAGGLLALSHSRDEVQRTLGGVLVGIGLSRAIRAVAPE